MPASLSPVQARNGSPGGDRDGAAADRSLMERIARGDPAALGELYDRHATVIFSVILRLLGDREEAEDITQVVFLSLSERAPHYNPAFGTPIAWLITMAKNRSLDHLRKLKTKAKHSERLLRDAESESEDRQAAPSAADETEMLRDAVDSLSPEQREVVRLAYYGMRTHTEIADMLTLPLGTVKARIRRGLLGLRTKCAALL